MKKLYTVSIETEIYVYAESGEKAEKVASESIRELNPGDFYCYGCLATDYKLKQEWKDCEPFTESRFEQTKTCGELYEEDQANNIKLEAEKRQLKLDF